MKQSSSLHLLVLAVLFCSAVLSARAQTPNIEIGPRLSFDLAGDIQEFAIGFDSRLSIPTLPVKFNGTFDYYFVDRNLTFYQIGFNVLVPFSIPNPALAPYVGGGFGISRLSVDNGRFLSFDNGITDTGLNIIGGAIFKASGLKPFAQAQLTIGDIDLFTITGGLLFAL